MSPQARRKAIEAGYARVTVECVTCGRRKEIGPEDVAPGDVPSCDKCLSPCVAVKAEVRFLMPKPMLKHEYAQLERDVIETLLAGHHEWRPDLPYPESHSDMSGAVRALLRMYEVKRRPVALDRGEIVHPKERCNGPCCAVEG